MHDAGAVGVVTKSSRIDFVSINELFFFGARDVVFEER